MFEISRSAFTLFGFDVHWYGLIIALGVLMAVMLACAREKKLHLQRDTALNIALIAVPAALICARLYYVVFSWDYYAAHPMDILNVRQGGLAIYGGVIGGVLAGYIYCRVKGISFAAGLDLAAPSLALGQAIGRWGNFINQEAYGRVVEDAALQFFPLAVPIGDAWHYATFFYESLWCALIVALILIGERRRFFHRNGDIFASYLLLYGVERALVEGLRTDSLYLGPIRVSQMLSLGLVIFVCILLARRARGIARFIPLGLGLMLGASLALNGYIVSVILAAGMLLTAAVIYRKSFIQPTRDMR